MTNPTLERAARAAYEAWIDDVRDLEPAWCDLPESHRDRLIQSARAVLMAVREPGQKAIDAGYPLHDGCDPTFTWQTMIDAILGENDEAS